MHIPDGYLSPETTIPGLVVMLPAWAGSLYKVKKALSKKQIPTLALCAAFSFVLMMFNVPVAGGSSAHAVGAVFIAILLGPAAATVAVSAALLIQALVFGDGGILAYGINCFNMALVMPWSGWFVYKLIAGNSPIASGKSIVGAFIGSYIGLNLAAAFAGFWLGIQPLLFTDPSGHPLYCPYPLSVSEPSMLLAHLAFAGPLEAVVTSAAIAYVAKFAPDILKKDEVLGALPAAEEKEGGIWEKHKAFIILLVVLLVLTPLGLIATGTAWGEWGTDELKQQLGFIPEGFAKFADWYKALLPDYGLPLGEDQSTGQQIIGYLISAVVGMGVIAALILLVSKIVGSLSKKVSE